MDRSGIARRQSNCGTIVQAPMKLLLVELIGESGIAIHRFTRALLTLGSKIRMDRLVIRG